MRLRSAFGFAFTVAVLLAAPATALAGGGFDLKFQFDAGDGYRVSVGGYDATAILTAAKPAHGRYAWSTYVARGKVSPTAIHAGFGSLGRVDMRFQPSGAVTHGKRHRHCIGADRYTIRPGVFVGSLRFRGEGGYTSAKVRRVKGKVVTPRTLRCFGSLFEELEGGGGGQRAKTRPKVTRLYSFLRSGLTAIFFAASERGGKAGFLAETEQTVGSLGVFRGVSVRASPATFAFDNTLSSAGVTPPAPFSGSGSLQRGSTGAKALTGSLAVSFPGEPNVPLTDPRFKTQLTRSW
ncbi:MAG TPA: hypothetical protein VGN84_05115 [Solirubrobacterales bacterium]|nr:hypothetical protein [Solirubrobacterales bacterium]